MQEPAMIDSDYEARMQAYKEFYGRVYGRTWVFRLPFDVVGVVVPFGKHWGFGVTRLNLSPFLLRCLTIGPLQLWHCPKKVGSQR